MGWSGGSFEAGEPLLNDKSAGDYDLTKVDFAWWYQVDVGYEGEVRSCAILRGALGYAFLVNRGDAYCVPARVESPGGARGTPNCPMFERANLWGIPTLAVSLGWRW